MKQFEEWKSLDSIGLPQYSISESGQLIRGCKYYTGSKRRNGYIYYEFRPKGERKLYTAHQLVAIAFLGHTPCGNKLVVDHIDGNPENNHVLNLQIITQRENLSKDKQNKTSQFTGVYWHKKAKKWAAQITIGKKVKYLGLFELEHEAHKAYEEAIKKAFEILETNNK